jgi:hypothetical protein
MAERKKKLKTVRELKNLIEHVKTVQSHLHKSLKNKTIKKDIQSYTELLGKEVRKYLNDDLKRVKSFLTLAREELEGFQKQYLNPRQKIKATIGKLKKTARPPKKTKSKVTHAATAAEADIAGK